MLLTTTPIIQGKEVETYLGVVSSEVIIGANVIKDVFAGFRDFFGGRSDAYEKVFIEAKENALEEMKARAKQLGANAVIGIDLDFQTVGSGGMLMVAATGTAVIIK